MEIDHIDKMLMIIQEGLLNRIGNLERLLIAITILCIMILLNQRKIRKELRQLREMMENQDKPQE